MIRHLRVFGCVSSRPQGRPGSVEHTGPADAPGRDHSLAGQGLAALNFSATTSQFTTFQKAAM
jgi:hypothetical protein